MLGRRRPLLRGAIVGGSAYAIGKHRARKQADEEAAEDEQNRQIEELQGDKQGSAQTAAPDATDDSMQKIKKLQQLHDSGTLTDDEFSSAKAKILDQM
jgi:hypothetical protein